MTPQELNTPTGGSSQIPADTVHPAHLTDDLLVCALDDELSGTEIPAVESHLSVCESCRLRFQEFRHLSGRVEASIAASPPVYSYAERDRLAHALSHPASAAPRTPQKNIRRFGWGMAVAATVTLALLYVPRNTVRPVAASNSHSIFSSTLEVDGETFVALPYSNPDLPVSSSHIVQMQVPVSSLADAGLVLEPVSRQIAVPDRSVLADVLLGMDGQPLGVHVLSE